MKELSIFIDESGDFGGYDPKAPFYGNRGPEKRYFRGDSLSR